MYFFVFANAKVKKIERYFYIRLICITFCCILNSMRKLDRQKLQEKIEKTGDTTFAFAKKHGFTYETLRRWLNGEREAKISNITKLACALNCSIEEITFFYRELNLSVISELEADREEIHGLLGNLNKEQRQVIIQMAQTISDANQKALDAEIY